MSALGRLAPLLSQDTPESQFISVTSDLQSPHDTSWLCPRHWALTAFGPTPEEASVCQTPEVNPSLVRAEHCPGSVNIRFCSVSTIQSWHLQS